MLVNICMSLPIIFSEVFAGMKIDRSTKATEAPTPQGDMELSRAHRVRRLMEERTREPHRMRMSESGREPQRPRRQEPRDRPTYIPIDLFGGPPLGIFTDKNDDAKTSVNQASHKLKTWDALHARDLKLAVTHPPANGFEEMILWTEQGKMWKFPIDNEQGRAIYEITKRNKALMLTMSHCDLNKLIHMRTSW